MCDECAEYGGVHQDRPLEYSIGNPIDCDGALFQCLVSNDGGNYNVRMRPLGQANEAQRRKATIYLAEMTKIVTDIMSAFMARS